VKAEGWYRDPFQLHEDRWFSAGRPTSLVRDGGLESHDPAPDTSFDGPLVEAPAGEAAMDDASNPDDSGGPQEGIWDVFGISQTGMRTDS
jgi:hypothetical protein